MLKVMRPVQLACLETGYSALFLAWLFSKAWGRCADSRGSDVAQRAARSAREPGLFDGRYISRD
jgi:hypothetical protein